MIDCEECSDHAAFNFKGLHDHINLGLSKKPHDIETYEKWYKEVKDTHDKCIKMGYCEK